MKLLALKGNKESPMSDPSVDEERVQEDVARAMERKEFKGVLFCKAQHRLFNLCSMFFFALSARKGRKKLTRRIKMSNG